MDAVLEFEGTDVSEAVGFGDTETVEEIPADEISADELTPAEEYVAAIETTVAATPVKVRKPRKPRNVQKTANPPISFRDKIAQDIADRLAVVDDERDALIAARKALGIK